MKHDAQTKLVKCETSIRRWQTRLVRATNMVTKLERQRRRLQTKMGPVNLTDLIGPPLSAKDVGADQETVKPLIDVAEVKRQVDAAIVSDVTDISWSEMTGADLNIPPFLKRTQADVDKLKAERKLKEAAAKKAMPLTGRAALAAIKAPPKKRRTA